MDLDFIGNSMTVNRKQDIKVGGTIELPYLFTPRPYQQPFFEAFLKHEIRRAILVWHRRAGKDKTVFNVTVCEAAKRVGMYLYMLPQLTQARKVIWDGRGKDGNKFTDHIHPDLIAKINNTEMKVELVNGSIIQMAGADNYDNMMGTNPLGIVFSEFSIQNPTAYDYFRPILAENGGWAIFDYTPRGRNHGYQLYNMVKDNPKWFVSYLTANDTTYLDSESGLYLPVITQEVIQEEIDSGMDEDMVAQEFYCSWDAATKGAIFGKQIRDCYQDARVGRVPIQKHLPVFTFWDFGYGDATAIWFIQKVGMNFNIVAYYEHNGEGIDFYAKILTDLAAKHEFSYGIHYGPHDALHHGFDGRNKVEIAAEVGIDFEVVPRCAKKTDSIEAAKKILPYCKFDDDRCEEGLARLADYQYKYDTERRAFTSEKPLHNWASNGSDAFQTFAMAWDDEVLVPKKPKFEKGRTGGDFSWMGA